MKTSLLFTMVPVSISLFTLASTALAGDDPCGKFDFSSGVSCEIKVQGGCETQCSPIHFQAACNGSCDASVSASCAVDCQGKCLSQCSPGSIDCKASCSADCKGRCNAECNAASCSDECDAACQSDCSASCEANPPSCEVSCQQSCNGACTAAANIDCDMDCYANLEGGCQTECEKPSGALFCNGQYVAASDIDACIAYIENNLNGSVNVEARGEAKCDLNGCTSSGSANGQSCSMSSPGQAVSGAGLLAALGLAAGAFARRRRNAEKKPS